MTDVLTTLDNIKRPRLLIRAARIGAPEYRRDVHLKRHLGFGALPHSEPALAKLIEIESTLNHLRASKNATYSALTHVDILIAMMGEARILRASQPSAFRVVVNS